MQEVHQPAKNGRDLPERKIPRNVPEHGGPDAGPGLKELLENEEHDPSPELPILLRPEEEQEAAYKEVTSKLRSPSSAHTPRSGRGRGALGECAVLLQENGEMLRRPPGLQ